MLHKWEQVDHTTRRMRVPGGWLYHIETFGNPTPPVFVPLSDN